MHAAAREEFSLSKIVEALAAASATTTSVKICVSKLVIPSGARDLTSYRGFARSFAFAQDDN